MDRDIIYFCFKLINFKTILNLYTNSFNYEIKQFIKLLYDDEINNYKKYLFTKNIETIIEKNYLKLFQYILSNHHDLNYNKILSTSNYYNNFAMVKKSVKLGANNLHHNLIISIKNGYVKLVDYYIKLYYFDSYNFYLELSIQYNQPKIIYYLIFFVLYKKYNLQNSKIFWNSCLKYSTISNNIFFISKFLKFGANNLNECLNLSCNFNNFRLADYFICQGADQIEAAIISAQKYGHNSLANYLSS